MVGSLHRQRRSANRNIRRPPVLDVSEDSTQVDEPIMAMVAPLLTPAAVANAVADGVLVEDALQVGFQSLDAHVKHSNSIQPGHNIYLKVLSALHHGADCVVYCVKDLYISKSFALKAIPMNGGRLAVSQADIDALKTCDHPNILKCYDTFVFEVKKTPFYFMQLELCEKGSLRSVIERKRTKSEELTTDQINNIIIQIASGLAYLHQQDILHGDLCPDHVLVASGYEVKLCGLGLPAMRRHLGVPLTITGGLQMYAPPEWANSAPLMRPLTALETPLSSYDMWSLGCVLSELCTLKFIEQRVGAGGSLALDGPRRQGLLNEMHTAHDGYFVGLCQKLLQIDSDDRIAAVDVVSSLKPLTSRRRQAWNRTLERSLRFLGASRQA